MRERIEEEVKKGSGEEEEDEDGEIGRHNDVAVEEVCIIKGLLSFFSFVASEAYPSMTPVNLHQWEGV